MIFVKDEHENGVVLLSKMRDLRQYNGLLDHREAGTPEQVIIDL